ncbi:thionin-like protein 2 [Ziziphus jujuba]|uniref:Thionin-like protein 2 n=2 Tax=Ziziphus jujuba TaxID=326968 RepID=A0ABM3IC79_ZIZJJ|nr:thionin-like protein 2 [Ziziphus jujuba]KAH7547317.1 hypothetical protein FEM48_Zijuj01G0296900 [Ziziphus jujuba var. spinosa]
MEDMKRMMIVFLVMGLLVMAPTTNADFLSCFGGCFAVCVITPGKEAASCAFKCLKDCILPSSSLQLSKSNSKHFCKLGCASTLCTKYSTKRNPNSKKVEGCVNSCSAICT